LNYFLIDGSGYIFRAFHAVPPLNSSKGLPTNALYGFLRMIQGLRSRIESVNDPQIAVVFDKGRKSFRTDIYEGYKSNRKECPAELVPQLPYFRKLVRALGVPCLEADNFEADDLIATLTTEFLKTSSSQVTIITADKDLMQLVEERVTLLDTMYNRIVDEEAVLKKFGVPPNKVADVLSLIGDVSDNIPGVPGIGEKGAASLIKEFGSVAAIFEESLAPDFSERVIRSVRSGKKILASLLENLPTLKVSRTLTEVRRDLDLVELEIFPPYATSWQIDANSITDLFEELEFNSLLKEFKIQFALATFNLDSPQFASFKEVKILQCDESGLINLFATLKGFPCFSITLSNDQETLFLSSDLKVIYAISQLVFSSEEFLKGISLLLESEKVVKVSSISKKVIKLFLTFGVSKFFNFFDNGVTGFLLRPESTSYTRPELVERYLKGERGHFAKHGRYEEGFSAIIDLWLYEAILAELKKEDLVNVYQSVEAPLIPVLARIETEGIKINTELLTSLSNTVTLRLQNLEEEITKLAGVKFNINSSKQLGEVLFVHLGLASKGIKKTKSGYASTDVSTLEKLLGEHPIIEKIMEYRGMQKLQSTYIEALPRQVSPNTLRIHTSLNQGGAATGRLSSSEPNLQNIPIASDLGLSIREAFISAPGKSLLSIDYSQIELRVLAHLSNDEVLINAFVSGEDIHTATAREILNIPKEREVSSKERRLGKTINFGVVYGISGFALGRDLQITTHEADELINRFYRKYYRIKEFFESIRESAHSLGYITTIMGRKRFTSEIKSQNRDRGFLNRALLNAPVQGSAADIIKLAMIAIDNYLLKEQLLDIQMILQVHDELLFEVGNDILEEVSPSLRKLMEGVYPLLVPLETSLKVGKNWRDVH
jgi:DNA polymerase-1